MVQTLPADEQAWRNVQAAQPESGYCKIKKLSGIGNWLLVWPGDAAAKCGTHNGLRKPAPCRYPLAYRPAKPDTQLR